jgi:hypothetical protein
MYRVSWLEKRGPREWKPRSRRLTAVEAGKLAAIWSYQSEEFDTAVQEVLGVRVGVKIWGLTLHREGGIRVGKLGMHPQPKFI